MIKSENSTFTEGFVTASLVFCVGAMAIVGSLEDGLNRNFSILFAKSILDGVTSVIFSATLGIGVMFFKRCCAFIPGFNHTSCRAFETSFDRHCGASNVNGRLCFDICNRS